MLKRNGLSKVVCTVFLSMAISCMAAPADRFPDRPVTIILPLQAGSASDGAIRTIAAKLSQQTGQPFIVENVPGAGGVIGAGKVAKSKPDGYVLGAFNNGVVSLIPNLPNKPSFDMATAFSPIGMVAELPSVLVVHPSVPAKTVSELVTYSKANPGRVAYGSVGSGSPQHIAMEMFKAVTKADLLHVPYRGGPQAVNDVISGEIQATWIAIPVAASFIKSGQLRALAVGSDKRSSGLASVPTMKEAGIHNFRYLPWLGLYAPAGTPPEIVTKLNKMLVDILGDESVRAKFDSLGLNAKPSNPDELGRIGMQEKAEMNQVVKQLNLD